MRRTLLVLALRLTIGVVVGQAFLLGQADNCRPTVITAFSVEQFPGTTADGTRTGAAVGEIVAASYNYALGSLVWIAGIGSRRVADRGHLGPNHIDVLFLTSREALDFGVQQRQVCQ